MTSQELIEEGRKLQRTTVLLTPAGSGDIAAYWYGRDYPQKSSDGQRIWLAVDGRFIPSYRGRGWLAIYTNEGTFKGGLVQVLPAPPHDKGDPLLSKEIQVLPPIDAVLACGSTLINHWLAENKWQRGWPYNRNFRDRKLVQEYEAVQQRENPLYWTDGFAYATLGGWPQTWPDLEPQWTNEAKLLVRTYAESEPWVEVWQLPSGEFEVMQHIT